MVKVNPKSDNGPSPLLTSTNNTIQTSIPKEEKKIDTKIKSNVEEKVKKVINKEKSNSNEAEGIMIELINNNHLYI